MEDSVKPPNIPDHDVLRPIGSGSYGQVWLVRTVTGQYRAAKVIYRSKFSDDHPFDREFAGLKAFEPISLSHPHLVHILHVGINHAEQYFYYIMELADDVVCGTNIDPLIYKPRTLDAFPGHAEPLPPLECATIGRKLADALDHLHRKNKIHRDIKPSNIIFVNGEPKLADIGLVTDPRDKVSMVGTPAYMPPEGAGSRQADIYGLGILLYVIGTGKDPKDFPVLPTGLEAVADVSTLLRLNAVILKACAKLDQRYQIAASMRDDLAGIQIGKAPHLRLKKLTRFVSVTALILLAAGATVAALYQLTGLKSPLGRRQVGNLALTGIASATQEESNSPAMNAIDGNNATAWACSRGLPARLEVDLLSLRTVSTIAVVWGKGAPNQLFSIDVSRDGRQWQMVVSQRWSKTNAIDKYSYGHTDSRYLGNSTVVQENFSIPAISARRIRLTIHGSRAPSSYVPQAIVNELEAYADADAVPTQHVRGVIADTNETLDRKISSDARLNTDLKIKSEDARREWQTNRAAMNELRMTSVHMKDNCMWNNHVYFSWQNIMHVNQPNNMNAVIDTWKYDDNNDGDPRNDASRIVHNGKTDAATGISFGLGNLQADQSGFEAESHIDAAGNGILHFSRDIAGEHIDITYTLRPDDPVLYGQFVFSVSKDAECWWGIRMLNSVYVDNDPGEMSVYDQCAVNNLKALARSHATRAVREQGIDFVSLSNVVEGSSALLSTARDWASILELESASIPVTMYGSVATASSYGGWAFDRCATIQVSAKAGQRYILSASFIASNASDVWPRITNVASFRNKGVATASDYGTYLNSALIPARINDDRLDTDWAGTHIPSWCMVQFDHTNTITRVRCVSNSHTQEYAIQLSNNGSDWRTVAEHRTPDNKPSGESEGQDDYDVAVTPQTAKYIRVLIKKTDAPPSHIFQAIISELQAFGY